MLPMKLENSKIVDLAATLSRVVRFMVGRCICVCKIRIRCQCDCCTYPAVEALLSAAVTIPSCLQASVTSHIVVKLLEEELNEVAYLAESADLSYSTHMDGMHGITFQVFGFSQRLPALTARVFETFAKLKVSAAACTFACICIHCLYCLCCSERPRGARGDVCHDISISTVCIGR